MQVPEVELPAVFLPAAMLAHQAVQPALDAPRESEVRRVYGQHQGGVQHAGIEPVRQDQLDAQRCAVGIGQLLPLVDPRKAVQAPSSSFADGRCHRGRLQPVERGLEALVVAQRLAAPDEAQDLVGRGLHPPRRLDARVLGFDDLAGGPDQDVCIPDGGNAMLLRAFYANGGVAAAKVDRRGAPRLRQREKRIGHQVLGIARCHVLARQSTEQVELFALLQGVP